MEDSEGDSVANEVEASIAQNAVDLDDVLVNELGQLGRYQLHSLLLVVLPLIASAFMGEYIFSAAAIPHRCYIEECGEEKHGLTYHQEWASDAVPGINSILSGQLERLASCQRYAPTGGNGTLDFCPSSLFNHNSTVDCDGFVYSRDNTVVYEFDLGCQEWYRAFSGTLNSIGSLLVLPITGYISDRFGRKVALIINVFNMALIGFLRAFSINYPMYMVLQLLQTTLGAGCYSSAYIFATELVGPKYRVATGALCSSIFAVGQIIMGSIAWLVQPWRKMTLTLHFPCFLIIAYCWIMPESIRWLLSKRKHKEAKKLLEEISQVNKRVISVKSLHALMHPPELTKSIEKKNQQSLLLKVIKSPIMLRRVCTTPIWWITSILVYYGLSINSTSLSDTMYLNYILTCAIEIPGYFTAVLTLDRLGRKVTLAGGFFLSSACNVAFAFLPLDRTVLRLLTFLLGKFGISVVMTSVYLYTSELYPTQYRHSLLGFSSMIGRIGAIVAPLTPVLTQYWSGVPSLLFGTFGLVSGLLVLTQPETYGTKMPDTLAEAEALGRPESTAQRNLYTNFEVF